MTPGGSHRGPAAPRRRWLYVAILGALSALGPFTIDTYLPALPLMARDLAVEEAAIQLTLGTTIAGFALGQLLIGPWSDRVGRRVPLLVTTSLHITSSIGCAFAPNVETLVALRAIEGLGAAGGGVVAIAMIRDLFAGRQLVTALAGLAAVMGAAPAVAPVVGAQLLNFMTWRGIFIVLATYGLTILVAVLVFIREPSASVPGRSRSVGTRYRRILGDRVFVGILLVSAATYCGTFSYISSSAFLFQNGYGLTPQEFGWIFAVGAAGSVIGSQLGARLTRRIEPARVLAITTAVALAAAWAIIAFGRQDAGPAGIVAGVFVFMLASGAAFPTTQAIALDKHQADAGTAASLLGAAAFGAAGIIAPVVGMLGPSDPGVVGAVLAACSAAAIASLWIVVRPRTVPPLGGAEAGTAD